VNTCSAEYQLGQSVGVPASAGLVLLTMGEDPAADATVGEVLSTKIGSITRARLPRGAPGWDAIRNMTMSEVKELAKKNVPGFKTILKLLRDKRFDKP
jgi:hypothetical protein